MIEKDIEDYLRKRTEELGCYCIKLNPSYVAGIPDEMVITLDGRCIFVELKTNEGKLSKYQAYTQKRLQKMHHIVYTLWCVEDVDKFIDKEILYK